MKMPLKIKVGGMQRSKPPQMKKVPPPIVPDMNTNRNSNFTATTNGRNSCVNNTTMDDNYPPPPSPLSLNHNIGRDLCDNSVYITANGSCPSSSSPVHTFAPYQFSNSPQHFAQVLLTARAAPGTPGSVVGGGSGVISTFSQPNSPHPSEDSIPGYLLDKYGGSYQQQTSLEDQGIDVQSPGRDSPSSSGSSSGSGCRHSITSLDSGRASSSAYDGRTCHTYLAGPNQHRLSGHSYESNTSLRQSYHSSSSSLGSMDRLDDGGSTAFSSAQINVCKLLSDGVPESEVLRLWLSEHRFDEYFHLFTQAGYDMPTISRMTPEDLTAIGITNPSHRKKLKVEIGKLSISDGLPDYIPSALEEWLQLLRLEEYYDCLVQQGYNKVEDVLGIAWEDLEEIGIKKLGHQKKIMLAIKRVKDIQTGVKRFSSAENRPALEVKCRIVPPPTSTTSATVNHSSTSGQYSGYMGAQESTSLTCPTTVRPVKSPTSSNEGFPTYHSFHHAASEAVDYIPYGGGGVGGGGLNYGPGSPSHIIYRPDIVAIQVRHPSGARSLENLEDGRENRHRTFLQVDTRWSVTTNNNNNTVNNNNLNLSAAPGPVNGTGGMGGGTVYHGMGGSGLQQSALASTALLSGSGQGQSGGSAGGLWRRGSFDDGDLTPTNEVVVYEMEGGGTLPRPKVSIKPRPVAKIVAKTRISAGGSDGGEVMCRELPDCDHVDKKNVVVVMENATANTSETLHHSSPRRSLPGSPLNSILRNKKVPPPPPPKRCNSIKVDRKSEKGGGGSRGSSQLSAGGSDYSNEQLFASCVKSIASKFGLTRKSDWNNASNSSSSSSSCSQASSSTTATTSPSPQRQSYLSQSATKDSAQKSGYGVDNVSGHQAATVLLNSKDDDLNDELCLDDDECGEIHECADRTPPSPAPGSPVHSRRDPTLGSTTVGDGGNVVSPDSSCSPLFHAKRNESTSSFESSGSTSSTESNTLPFANENVGTIKQRAIKPHPPLTTLDLACSPQASPILSAKSLNIAGSRSAPATPKRRSSLGSDRPGLTTATLSENDDLRMKFRPQETGDVLNDIDNMLANLTEELDAMLTSELQSE